MSDDTATWLDAFLHDNSDEEAEQTFKRACTAAAKRTSKYAEFLDKSQTPDEFRERLALIDTGIRQTAAEAARDYDYSRPEMVYESALKVLAERGAILNRDPNLIDPDKGIAGTEGSGFVDVPGKGKAVPQDVWPDSTQHPRELQDIDPLSDRYLEHEALKNDNAGPESIKKKVEEIDAQSPVGPELVGAGGTFGDSHGTSPAVTSKWHVLGE
jgi:hypothetical protein